MFGLADRGNKSKVNSVWVMFWYYWTYGSDQQEPTNQWTGLMNQGQFWHHKHDQL